MTYQHREFTLDDLDVAILRELPDEGSKHGKYLNDGRSVKQLVKIIDPSLTSAFFAGRINAMRFNGYVVGVKGATTTEYLWQITVKGKKALSGLRAVKQKPEEAQAS